MDTDDLIYLCMNTADLSGVPVRLYRKSELLYSHSTVRLPADPVRPDLDAVMAPKAHVSYHVNGMSYYYGAVAAGDMRVVIGPSRLTPGLDGELRELAFRLRVPSDDVPDFVQGMKQIAQLPLEAMLQLLCTLNFTVNGEKLTIADIIGGGDDEFGMERERARRTMAGEDGPTGPRIIRWTWKRWSWSSSAAATSRLLRNSRITRLRCGRG